jgi:hypothetical protein
MHTLRNPASENFPALQIMLAARLDTDDNNNRKHAIANIFPPFAPNGRHPGWTPNAAEMEGATLAGSALAKQFR